MHYIMIAIQIALVLWLVFNIYQFGLAYRDWRENVSSENTFLNFLLERFGALGRSFVYTIVYTTIAIGVAYLLYEFIAMLME